MTDVKIDLYKVSMHYSIAEKCGFEKSLSRCFFETQLQFCQPLADVLLRFFGGITIQTAKQLGIFLNIFGPKGAENVDFAAPKSPFKFPLRFFGKVALENAIKCKKLGYHGFRKNFRDFLENTY